MPEHVFTVRETRPADVNVYMELVSRLNPDAPDLVPLRRAFDENGQLTLRANLTLALVATDERGRPVGALLGGVPKWLVNHPVCTPLHTIPLVKRVAYISALFVRPEYRKIGVGRSLIERAEIEFRAAGRRLVTLMHTPELVSYYNALGYETSSCFAAYVPKGLLLIAESADGTHMAAKALDPRVGRATVFGVPVPVLTGVLCEETLPAGAWFDGERLRF